MEYFISFIEILCVQQSIEKLYNIRLQKANKTQ